MLIRWTDFRPKATQSAHPFGIFDAFQREFERAVGSWDSMFQQSFGDVGRRIPRVNLYDKDEHLHLVVEIPGFTQEDLELEANAEGLTLQGKRKSEAPEGMTLRHQEREQIEFSRSLRWPVPVDVDQIEATLKDGILQVKIAKAPEAKPRNIEIALR